MLPIFRFSLLLGIGSRISEPILIDEIDNRVKFSNIDIYYVPIEKQQIL
jgi:hypothetical protein